MSIEILPYRAEHEEAVRAFNARLAAARLDPALYSTRFPDSHVPQWLPNRPGCDLYQECFVAVDEQSRVRGGYILKHQPFLVKGTPSELAAYQLPISEGIIDRAFTNVGVSLYMDALRRHPRLWGLGGGGLHVSIGKFLVSAGWRTTLVPFWFRIVHPNAFLQNIAFLRTSPLRCWALDVLRCTGLGWAGIKAAFALRERYRPPAGVAGEIVPEFSGWADEVWEGCRMDYSLIAVRDRQTLNVLYPVADPRFIRLKISRDGQVLGWAVLLNTPMSGSSHFGNMRVGTLVDCLARPEDAREVVACAREVLEAGGTDLLVSNQAGRAWCQALRRAGFREGPSNFPLFMSPKLAELFHPFEDHAASFHVNRGDGDGPIHL